MLKRMMIANFLCITMIFASESSGFVIGTPEIKSMSVLKFTPDGVLLIGDSKGGIIYAVQLNEKKIAAPEKGPEVQNIEKKIAAMTGASAEDVLIHDMAVSPVSYDTYISVSRGRAKWVSQWQLPNYLDDARILFRVKPDGTLEEVSLQNVQYTSAKLPNPVDENSTVGWEKTIKLRMDAISAIQFDQGKVYVTGLSNENFKAALWVFPYPFTKDVTATTVEIYHGAHGQYETDSPIRTFQIYNLSDGPQILAAYLCTPLATFPITSLQNGKHIKGKTVAEFGSGNYPLDMVTYKREGRDLVVMANSNLPLIVFDPKEIDSIKEGITSEVQGYTAGLNHTKRSGIGVQHLDLFSNKYLISLRRMPGGSLDLALIQVDRMQP